MCSIEWFLQSGPLPVISRVIAPLIGCISPLTHLEGHLNRRGPILQGFTVRVLEASDRVGGRTYSVGRPKIAGMAS